MRTRPDQYTYGYDGLDRVAKYNQGTLTGTPKTIADGSATFNQQWLLDALGNWGTFKWDVDGGGDSWVTQSRSHNQANEIDTDDNHGNTPGDAIASAQAGGQWRDPVYDGRGNLIQGPKPGSEVESGQGIGPEQRYTYDAWNRLIKVQEYPVGGSQWEDVAQYEYDGLNRRIVRVDKTGESDVTYDDYFNNDWQLLETRKGGDEDPQMQYVWDQRYIDAAVCRFRDDDTDGQDIETLYHLNDANMNVTALCDTSGGVVERYDYDPYGKTTVLNADWTLDTSGGGDGQSDVDNSILFAGYRYDGESGLYHVRNRMYHPTLGRWGQRDPAHYADGMSLYQYGRACPSGHSDPSGRCSDSWLDGTVVCMRAGFFGIPGDWTALCLSIGCPKHQSGIYHGGHFITAYVYTCCEFQAAKDQYWLDRSGAASA